MKRFLVLAFTIIFWWLGMVLADAGLPRGVGSADHVAASSQNPPPNCSLPDFLAILEKVKGHIREIIARELGRAPQLCSVCHFPEENEANFSSPQSHHGHRGASSEKPLVPLGQGSETSAKMRAGSDPPLR